MTITYSDYLTALRNPTRSSIYKIEWLDSDENVSSVVTPDLIDGTLTLDKNKGIRRSCNLLLENTDGSYNPVEEGFLWVNSKMRLYTGLTINSETYYNSRGIFVISEPQINSFLEEKTGNLQFLDKWAMLDGTLAGVLGTEYIINVGTSIPTAVKAIFTAAGEVKTPIIEPTAETTPYTIVKSSSETYADILNELALMLSWECFYDKNGVPRFEPPPDPDSDASIWDFSISEVTYRGSSRKFEFNKIKNRCIVIGDNIAGSIVRSVAEDTNVSSPTRIALIGEINFVIEDNLISTSSLADDRSAYELQKTIQLYESVDISCIPVDIINENSIITITDSSNDLSADRFLVQSINYPLKYDGEMTMSVWNTRSLS